MVEFKDNSILQHTLYSRSLGENRRLDVIRKFVERFTHKKFNSCLVNLYEDERDYVAYHADDEPLFGDRPVIASVSFGGTRRFLLKSKMHPMNYRMKILLVLILT